MSSTSVQYNTDCKNNRHLKEVNRTLYNAANAIQTDYTHVLEFGTYAGRMISHLRDVLPLQYQIFGFDSYVGLPEDWIGTNCKKEDFDLGGIVPVVDNVTFYKGWFKDTILEYKKIAQPIALLHIDCDLYSSTIDVLYGLNKYILPGTVISFDEWYYNHNDVPENRLHEQKAFFEWVNDYNIKFQEFPVIEDERKMFIIL